MKEVAHDSISFRPVVAVAGGVVGAELAGAARGLAALDAETHDTKPRRPNDLPIAAAPTSPCVKSASIRRDTAYGLSASAACMKE